MTEYLIPKEDWLKDRFKSTFFDNELQTREGYDQAVARISDDLTDQLKAFREIEKTLGILVNSYYGDSHRIYGYLRQCVDRIFIQLLRFTIAFIARALCRQLRKRCFGLNVAQIA